MKLLHVIPTIDPKAGGTTEAMVRIASVMHAKGLKIEVATLDAPDAFSEVANTYPWPTHKLGPGKLGVYGYSKHASDWHNHHVNNYDAILIHGMWQYHGFAASRACRRSDVPYFIFAHGMLDPWFNETYPLKKLKKLCYWFWGEHPVLKYAQSVLFTCEEEKRLARQSFRPYTVNETVVGLGTKAPIASRDELRASFERSKPDWATQPYFLFMSRIQEKKGLNLLVDAYAKLRSETENIPDLVIAGPIQQENYAAQIKQNHNQEGIQWVGSLHGDLKWQALAAAEALVLSSHQENFGIVVAEALAVGTPTLISNKVNIWREIENGNAGLVANDSAEATYRMLVKWTKLEPDERKTMSTAARQTFIKYFEIEQSTERLICVIRNSLPE